MEINLCGQSWIKVQVTELIRAFICYGYILSAWCFILAFRWIEFVADDLRQKFPFSYEVKFLCLQKGFKVIYCGVTSKFANSLVVKTLSLWMATFGHDPQLAAVHTYCLSMQVPCYCCLPTSTAFHVALVLNISPSIPPPPPPFLKKLY